MRVTKVYQFGHMPHNCDTVARQDFEGDPLPVTFTNQYNESVEFKFANPSSLQAFAQEMINVAHVWADDRGTWA